MTKYMTLALVLLALALAGATKLWLKARDDIIALQGDLKSAYARANELSAAAHEERERRIAQEGLRLELQEKLNELQRRQATAGAALDRSLQGSDCAAAPVPADAVRVFCESAPTAGGPCAGAGGAPGPAGPVPDAGPAGR